MNLQGFDDLGGAFTRYVTPFLGCCPYPRTERHFTTYCLGLLSGL